MEILRQPRALTACLLFLGLVSPLSAFAVTVTYDFVAQITSTTVSGGVPTTTVPIGEVITGSITLNSEPAYPDINGSMNYAVYGSQTLSSPTIGIFQETPTYIFGAHVRNDYVQGATTYDSVQASASYSGTSLPISNFWFQVRDYDATAINDTSLPTSFTLANFEDIQFHVSFSEGSPFCTVSTGCGANGQLTQLSATVVPIPAAVWLFGSGLLGLVGMARRKKAA